MSQCNRPKKVFGRASNIASSRFSQICVYKTRREISNLFHIKSKSEQTVPKKL